MAEPTDYEQLMLELINRARSDPQGEADRYDVDLNAGLPAGTISADPKQPLAMNPLLVDAARAHSTWMLDNNVYSQTGANGSSAGDRMQMAGYTFVSPSNWGENLSAKGTTEPFPADLEPYVLDQHERLFLSEEHRENLLGDAFREVGIGQDTGSFTPDDVTYNLSMITQNYALSGNALFLVGVVYEDLDGDGAYSPGEGLDNVKVSARGHTAEIWSETWGSGGYQLRLDPGTYEVTFSGGELSSPSSRTVTLSDQNGKLDLIASNAFTTPPNAFYIFTDDTPATFFMAEGIDAQLVSDSAGKTINIAEGSTAFGLSPDTTVNLEGSSSDYRLSRDGMTLEIQKHNGQTIASINAVPDETSSVRFSNGAVEVSVDGSNNLVVGAQVLEDGQQILGNSLSRDSSLTSSGVFSDANDLPGADSSNAFLVLTDATPDTFTLGDGLVLQLMGDTAGKTLNLPTGTSVANVDPETTVNFEAASTDFTFTRNGTTLEVRDDVDDLTASLHVATDKTSVLRFADGSMDLSVAGTQLMLGGETFTDGLTRLGSVLTLDTGQTSEEIFSLGARASSQPTPLGLLGTSADEGNIDASFSDASLFF